MKNLKETNLIIAVGSVDGVATTAALMNYLDNPQAALLFTQPFQVDQLDPTEWKENRQITFVDLAVNNRDPQMTVKFVQRIKDAGHEIVAIIDEHDADAWVEVWAEAMEDVDLAIDLAIKPQSQADEVHTSSGKVLALALGDQLSPHAQLLCYCADVADAGKFAGIGYAMNAAIKADIRDNSRRVYLARHFAKRWMPDTCIAHWVSEYETIQANNRQAIEAAQQLAPGIVRVAAGNKKIDATSIMMELYKTNKIVVLEGMAFNKNAGKSTLQVSFGTNDKTLDLKAILDEAGIQYLGGFPQKMNVEPQYEDAAFVAIKEAIAISQTASA